MIILVNSFIGLIILLPSLSSLRSYRPSYTFISILAILEWEFYFYYRVFDGYLALAFPILMPRDFISGFNYIFYCIGWVGMDINTRVLYSYSLMRVISGSSKIKMLLLSTFHISKGTFLYLRSCITWLKSKFTWLKVQSGWSLC